MKQRIDQIPVDAKFKIEDSNDIWEISVPNVNGLWWITDGVGGMEIPADTEVEVVEEPWDKDLTEGEKKWAYSDEQENGSSYPGPIEWSVMSDSKVDIEKALEIMARQPTILLPDNTEHQEYLYNRIAVLEKEKKQLEALILDWYVKTSDSSYAEHMKIQVVRNGQDVE